MVEPLSILVVEDDAIYAQFVADTLREAGHDVDIVATSEQARDKVRSRAPDAVMLDLHLPDGNGYDIARTLRGMLPNEAVIIMLTATQFPELDLADAVGVDLVLTKPVEVKLVTDIVDHVRTRRQRKLQKP
ncbi:MAG TPA: response regulator [Kofleriaceae bacterium]|nr:response regulator [Kofleriaceae bacterium]